MQSKVARIFLGYVSLSIRVLSFLCCLLGVLLLFCYFHFAQMHSSTVYTITNLSVFGVAFLVAGIIIEMIFALMYLGIVLVAWIKHKVLSQPGKIIAWNLLSFALTIVLTTFTLVVILNSNLPAKAIASNDIWWSFQRETTNNTNSTEWVAKTGANGQYLFSDFRQSYPSLSIPYFYTYHPNGSLFLNPYTHLIYFAFAILLLFVIVAITYATIACNTRFVRTEPWLVDWFYEHYDARWGKKPPKVWEPLSGNVLLAPENLYEMNRVCPKCHGGLRRISGLNSNNVYVQCLNFPRCAYILNWVDYIKFIKFSGGGRRPTSTRLLETSPNNTVLVKSLTDTKTVKIETPKRFRSGTN